MSGERWPIGCGPVTRVTLIALATLQDPAHRSITAFLRLRPRAAEPWRVMTHMLVVATSEFRNPILRFIKVEANDRLSHTDTPPTPESSRPAKQIRL